MPHVDLKTPTGDISLAYQISTPKSPSSPSIIPDLPTIIFIHAFATSKEVFQRQFSDPSIRQFNCVALDLRLYGESVGLTGDPYTPTESAHDLYLFMNALGLPPCHIFTVGVGSSVALEFASTHPDKVVSMTLCSPISSVEPDNVRTGLAEAWGYWEDAYRTYPVDQDLVRDVVFGADQLLYNNEMNVMNSAFSTVCLNFAQRLWTGDPGLREGRKVVIDWIVDRKRWDQLNLDRIQCPVQIIHCKEDIAFPVKVAHALKSHLESVGVKKVDLYQVHGPHAGCFINPESINAYLEDMILTVTGRKSNPIPVSKGQVLPTPFTEAFVRAGWNPGDLEDGVLSDDESWSEPKPSFSLPHSQ